MKKVIFNCDHCKGTIRNMHMGLVVSPVQGATDIGDWRGKEHEFCGVDCMVDFVMEKYPRRETVVYQRATVGLKYFTKAVKQGVFSRRNVLQAVVSLAQAAKLHGLIRLVGQHQDEWLASEAPEIEVEIGETGHPRAFLKKESGGA